METKKYNLHPAKSDGVQTSIQLQSSDDNDFLRNLLKVNYSGHTQQDSEPNSSSRELDCSGLVDTDSDNPSTHPCSFDRLTVAGPSTSANKTSNSDTQDLINQTILQQLTVISERLDKIEQNPVKKTMGSHKSKSRSAGTKQKVTKQSHSTLTSNHSEQTYTNATDIHAVPSTVSLPTLDHLKANDSIQKAVAERLSELQHLNSTGMSQKMKSQCGGEVFVKQKVRWPHEYVLAGSNKERVTYDKLSLGQWMAVFCRTMREADQNF